jgi:hypothetical protein
MKSISVWSAVLVCLAAGIPGANANPAACPATLPAGVVIRVYPDEKLTAGISEGPTILTVGSDVRLFPNRPPLIARGSKVLGTIVDSKQAGRLHGKARMRLALTAILTSDLCEYPIDSRIVEAGGYRVNDEVVWGRGHARRDLFALLFPPTTIYQLLRLPGRGPKLELTSETPLNIKLLQPVSLGAVSLRPKEDSDLPALRTRVDQVERDFATIKTALGVQTAPLQEMNGVPVVSGPCPPAEFGPSIRPVVERASVVRPLRNLTPYHVSVFLDQTRVAIVPPCFGPSMIATPITGFKLEAAASLLTTEGQKQIGVKIVPSSGGTGWDIVPDTGELKTARAN